MRPQEKVTRVARQRPRATKNPLPLRVGDKKREPCGPYSVEKRDQKLWARQMIKKIGPARLPILKLWYPQIETLSPNMHLGARHSLGSRLRVQVRPFIFSNSKAVRSFFVAEMEYQKAVIDKGLIYVLKIY